MKAPLYIDTMRLTWVLILLIMSHRGSSSRSTHNLCLELRVGKIINYRSRSAISKVTIVSCIKKASERYLCMIILILKKNLTVIYTNDLSIFGPYFTLPRIQKIEFKYINFYYPGNPLVGRIQTSFSQC